MLGDGVRHEDVVLGGRETEEIGVYGGVRNVMLRNSCTRVDRVEKRNGWRSAGGDGDHRKESRNTERGVHCDVMKN